MARTRVLLIEDNPVDVHLINYALQEEATWPTETSVAEDGEEAIEYLLQQGSFANVSKPDLVILDLNLPKRDGIEVLQVIRTREELRMLPVIVLSSSSEDIINDKLRQAHVMSNCSLSKPIDADEFLALGKKFRRCYETAVGSKTRSAESAER